MFIVIVIMLAGSAVGYVLKAVRCAFQTADTS